MSRVEPLVSIGLPVFNGERTVGTAARSVLAQDHAHLELVISDNASDDGTEEICRELAAADERVRYVRQPENIGLLRNFYAVLHEARGTYFKWIGDDDWLTPTYVRRCVEVLDDDPLLILVTTQQGHVGPGGDVRSTGYDREELRSPRPLERFKEMLYVLSESHIDLDPLYGMMRPGPVAMLPRPVMVNEDQVFAGRLALAGPFGHIDEVLSYRGEASPVSRAAVARRLGAPAWQARVPNLVMCRELSTAVREAGLDARGRRAARAAIVRFFVRRQQVTIARRVRKLAGLVPHSPRVRGRSADRRAW
jgi:glycosyltransferase involved in cell wall biosynthesis